MAVMAVLGLQNGHLRSLLMKRWQDNWFIKAALDSEGPPISQPLFASESCSALSPVCMGSKIFLLFPGVLLLLFYKLPLMKETHEILFHFKAD